MSTRIITGSTAVMNGNEFVVRPWLAIDDGVITDLGNGDPPSSPDVELRGSLLPGFVDIHVHGGGGASFVDSEGTLRARDYLARHGTTTFYASLISDSIAVMEQQIADLVPLVDAGLVAGIHLEGPFLSHARPGAHDLSAICNPDASVLDRLLEAIAGRPAMITLAPELPGGTTAIERCRAAGVLVAMGHSDARAAEATAGLNAGARVVTHLFNAMRPVHHRDPGMVEVALTDERVTVELILDGEHLSDLTVTLAMRCAPDRWISVSDSAYVAGLPDGDYLLGGQAITLSGNSARVASTGALAGSTSTQAVALAHLTTRLGLPLEKAISGLSRRPAQLISRPDLGTLSIGARADIVLWHEAAVARVMRDGRWLS